MELTLENLRRMMFGEGGKALEKVTLRQLIDKVAQGTWEEVFDKVHAQYVAEDRCCSDPTCEPDIWYARAVPGPNRRAAVLATRAKNGNV